MIACSRRCNEVATPTAGAKVLRVVNKHCCIARSTRTTRSLRVSSSTGAFGWHALNTSGCSFVECVAYSSACDMNARRKLGASGAGVDVVSCQHTPLLMCATWGLCAVVLTLLEHRADVNARDSDGKSSLHIAIENQHQEIVSVLLTQPDVDLMASDNSSMTAFGAAIATKNHKAAQAIVAREPQCAEQVSRELILSSKLLGLVLYHSYFVAVHKRKELSAPSDPEGRSRVGLVPPLSSSRRQRSNA